MDYLDAAKNLLPNLETVLNITLGGIAGWLLHKYRKRLRILPYKVEHVSVAYAANDATFGNIELKWSGNNVEHLSLCTVTLENKSAIDWKNVRFKIFANDSLVLLTHSARLQNSSFALDISPEFKKILAVDNAEPTQSQKKIFHGQREFLIPVFNRRDTAQVQLLYTTTPNFEPNKAGVWLDVLHEGVKAKYHPNAPEILGVKESYAIVLGCLILLSVLFGSIYFHPNSWQPLLICTTLGFFVKVVGAYLYKCFIYLKHLIDE